MTSHEESARQGSAQVSGRSGCPGWYTKSCRHLLVSRSVHSVGRGMVPTESVGSRSACPRLGSGCRSPGPTLDASNAGCFREALTHRGPGSDVARRAPRNAREEAAATPRARLWPPGWPGLSLGLRRGCPSRVRFPDGRGLFTPLVAVDGQQVRTVNINQRRMNMTTKTKPVHAVKIGLVEAAIWQNDADGRPRYNLKVTRRYAKEEQGTRTWHSTDSFGRDDLLALAKVVDLAHTWIHEQVTAKTPTQPEA